MRNNGTTPTYGLWEWKFSDNRCAVLYGDGNEPWTTYTPAPGSQLAEALAAEQPSLDWSVVPRIALVRSTAIGVAAMIRQLRRDQGRTVLRSRTWARRGPMVSVTVDGVEYPSLRAAWRGSGIGWNRLCRLYHEGRL